MATFANEYLVSKNSRDRFFRWQEDLLRAEDRVHESRPVTNARLGPSCVPCQFDTSESMDTCKRPQRDHTAAIMTGTWNEGQPDSPYAGTPAPDSASGKESLYSQVHPPNHGPAMVPGVQSPRHAADRLPLAPNPSHDCRYTFFSTPVTLAAARRDDTEKSNQPTARDVGQESAGSPEPSISLVRDGSYSPPEAVNMRPLELAPGSGQTDDQPFKRPRSSGKGDGQSTSPPSKRHLRSNDDDEDHITDTIGAIAIDGSGRIAAGSSSGGIGMKHRGRLGPAALVGIGTAVVPCSDDDAEGVTVAAVTSGTGEHMATTMASQRCAERIHRGTRRARGGGDVQEDNEDLILESFILDDFMGHPGVRSCSSQGAIGIMVVKKCRTGYYLYFAHNTDSFALASMGALEKEPRCTMSRLPEGAKIAKGGRKIRVA